MTVRTIFSAKTLVKLFVVSEFSVPEASIFVKDTEIQYVDQPTRLTKRSFKIPFDVMYADGRQEEHLVAVDADSGDVILIY